MVESVLERKQWVCPLRLSVFEKLTTPAQTVVVFSTFHGEKGHSKTTVFH